MLKSGLVTIGGRPLHNHEITPYFSCHSEYFAFAQHRLREDVISSSLTLVPRRGNLVSLSFGEILRHVVPQNDKLAPLCHSEQLHRHFSCHSERSGGR